jgi:hypothetical protein
MMNPLDDAPAAVVQRQLDAYNRKDLEGWLATYAPDAQQFELGGGLLAQGHEAIRARAQARFADPDLHAQLIRRIQMGPVVIDHEWVIRRFPSGLGHMEMVCFYQVAHGLIQSATFSFGLPMPGMPPPNP